MKLVAHNGSRAWGGNEKWLATVAEGLIARGHEVVVSCRREGPVRDELERRGVPASTVQPGGDLDLPGALRFAWWLRRQRPDALLLTSWNRTFWGGWAGRRAGVRRIAARLGIVRRIPGTGKYRRAFERYIDAVIVNSREIEADLLRRAPWLPPESIRVVLNGVAAPAVGASRIREELGLGPAAPLLAAAGRLAPRKGFDLLLAAFALVPEEEARLVIAGSGEAERELRERARELGIADRVHWLGFRQDVPAVLAGCDIFVLASRNEGMANVMLEAMAVGTPVVATAVAGAREALAARDGRPAAGWIVPPDDVEALAAVLGTVLRTARSAPAEVERRRTEARERVARWFSVDRMLDDMERTLFEGGGRET